MQNEKFEAVNPSKFQTKSDIVTTTKHSIRIKILQTKRHDVLSFNNTFSITILV